MNASRRDCLRAGAAAAAMFAMSAPRAQTASRLTLLVGGPAGGAVDVATRLMADQLREMGYVAVVENHAGAGGVLAIENLRKAPPDGGTLLVTPPGVFTIYPHINGKLTYKPSEFIGVATLCGYQFGFAAGPAAPGRTLAEFLAWAKENPKLASFGTPGAGTEPHFIGTELQRLSGVALNHVPYRGGAQAMTDLAGGHLPALITALPNLVSQAQNGKIRTLFTTGTRRSVYLPDVPTASESGFPEIASDLFYGVFAPAQVPPATLANLTRDIRKATSAPAYQAGLKRMAMDPFDLSREELARSMATMSAKWGEVVARSGFRAD